MYIKKGSWKRKISILLSLMITLTLSVPGASVSADSVQAASDTVLTPATIQPGEEPAPVPTQPGDSLTPIPTQPGDNLTPVPTQSGDSLTPVPTQQGDSLTPVPTQPGDELTPVPTLPAPVDTPSPMPSLTPTPTPVPTPSPTPNPAFYQTDTLKRMATYNYTGSSVTGISKEKADLAALNALVKNYGILYGAGMPYEEYDAAMSYMWEDKTEYGQKPIKLSVDIKNTMNYDTYVNILKKLSRYKGVHLYKIGTSSEGRDIYAIEIDVPSTYKKNVVMMTGQIHAREFGGGTFIVKEFVDLVQKAQTDKNTMEILKKNKFVAVPIVNVDGREAIINAPTVWYDKKGGLYKAYTNGTDGGRNFPGIQWGQVAKGSKFRTSIATAPGYANYPGPYAGSNNETKALMKFLYHYTVVEQAKIYLDLHDQGAIIYAGKTWQTTAQMQKSKDLRTNVMNILNKGITRRKYSRVYENSLYGMRGEGSSLTDYAASLAVGAKFSPAYGFSAFTDGKNEYILMQVKDLDTSKIKFKEANKNFAALTIEIGYGDSYLGNSSYTRRLLSNEYNYYNFGKLLETLSKMIK